jgi:hypothetical protein
MVYVSFNKHGREQNKRNEAHAQRLGKRPPRGIAHIRFAARRRASPCHNICLSLKTMFLSVILPQNTSVVKRSFAPL